MEEKRGGRRAPRAGGDAPPTAADRRAKPFAAKADSGESIRPRLAQGNGAYSLDADMISLDEGRGPRGAKMPARTYALLSQKGGSGKSTLADVLVAAAAQGRMRGHFRIGRGSRAFRRNGARPAAL